MELHVIAGSGPVGTATAQLLLDAGHRVRVITRSGTGPDGAELVAADAADADRLADLTAGAAALYNCVNPAYHRWLTDWPPIAAALLAAAERSGAVLATVGNLYNYGLVSGPMTEQTPERPSSAKSAIRAAMWADALAAHQAGRARVTEVRGSSYLGGQANSVLTDLVLPALFGGKTLRMPGDPDAPHTWTNTRDVATLLVTAAADERAWGKFWHVPSAPAIPVRALTGLAAELAGLPVPKIAAVPSWVVRAGGLVSRDLREISRVLYQFERPFVLDSSAAERTFGLTPTPVADGVASVLSGRSQPGVRPGR